MISRRAALAALVFAAWSGKALRAHAAAGAEVNQRFQVLAPAQPVTTGDQVEIIEFFWYGCPYCFELQPLLQAWLRRKPPDTAFRRIPALRREGWGPHARIYYALAELGEVERLHQKVYDAYHLEALALSRPEVVAQWAARHGIDQEKWFSAYRSAQVDKYVEAAREATTRYQVPGTPSFVVDGRYITSSELAGSVPRVLPVVDELIRLARSDRARRNGRPEAAGSFTTTVVT